MTFDLKTLDTLLQANLGRESYRCSSNMRIQQDKYIQNLFCCSRLLVNSVVMCCVLLCLVLETQSLELGTWDLSDLTWDLTEDLRILSWDLNAKTWDLVVTCKTMTWFHLCNIQFKQTNPMKRLKSTMLLVPPEHLIRGRTTTLLKVGEKFGEKLTS